jgi:carbamoyltransferase
MVILGLHFGHDAAISILQDGKLLLCVERERLNRVKHAMSIHPDEILLCLEDVGLTLDQVDFCALTSTQLVEYVFMDKKRLHVTLGKTPAHRFPCTMSDQLNIQPEEMARQKGGWLRQVFETMPGHPYHQLFPDAPRYIHDPENLFGGFEKFVDIDVWMKSVTFPQIARTDYSRLLSSDEVSMGFHYPAVTHLENRAIPSYIFSHHYAHVAYTFYESPYQEAALISHDGAGGGGGYGCGFFAYGKRNRIFPISPNNMAIGEIYDSVADHIGLKGSGGAGKLMGLSAYGKPRFFDSSFVGNWYDNQNRWPQDWIKHCEQVAHKMGYDLTPLGNKNKILEPINVDFAASTQKLVEETMLEAATTLHSALRTSDTVTKNLCLSGGIALNCPANTRLTIESPFESIFVPPAVSDQGLAIGSAYALYYNVMGHPRDVDPRPTPTKAYLGLKQSASQNLIEKTLAEYGGRISVERYADYVERAADDLAQNKVIGWFYGRSEIGPRALGHRSIIANPGHAENWERVNMIKGREHWRPFAPIVLEEDASEYFDSTQFPTYYMLLNAEVRSKKIPAVTHVDGSSRVQSVNAECGPVYDLLKAFKEKEDFSVLMNTSFNGPGEPIVETPAHAIEFLLNTRMDALYFEGIRVTRLQS